MFLYEVIQVLVICCLLMYKYHVGVQMFKVLSILLFHDDNFFFVYKVSWSGKIPLRDPLYVTKVGA